MRFKRIEIDDYGPLQGWSLKEPGDFNLLFGRNEAGKTLVIEAIWKMLWKKHARKLRGAERVDEQPRGFLRLEVDGEDVRFPDVGNLDSRIDLTPELCRNTFIVRNSDLFIENEGDYFTQVTSRLTGLKSAEIDQIEEAVRQIALLTPGKLIFKDDAPSGKLKSRIENARKLREEIDSLLQRIKEKGWDELERELVSNIENIQLLEQDLKELELARRRKMYEEGKEANEELKKLAREISDLQEFSREQAAQWWELNSERRGKAGNLEKLSGEEKEFQAELKEVDEELQQVESELNRLGKAKGVVDGEVLPDLKEMERKEQQLTEKKKGENFLRNTGIASLILIVISGLLAAFVPEMLNYSYAAGALGLAFGVFSWFRIYTLKKEEGEIAGILSRIKNNLQPFGINSEEKKDLVIVIEKLQQEYEEWESKKSNLGKRRSYAERRIQEINRDQKDLQDRIEKIDQEIEEIKKNSSLEDLDQYKQKLKRKEGLKERETKLIYDLQRIFQLRDENRNWDKLIEDYSQYQDQAPGQEYTEKVEKEKEEKLVKLKEMQKEKENELENFRKELKEIEREVNKEVFPEEEFIPCSTSLDLEEVKKKIDNFVNFHETNKERAKIVIDIFSQIKEEEEEKVSEIFAGSRVGEIFAEITGGRYNQVSYDRESGEIIAWQEGGKIIPARNLSGGAFDQLYLAIRVAMGEKILGEKTGFFILDDPFIKADQDRLKRLLGTIKELTTRGWQVLYFTCKNEVREILEPSLENGEIKLVEI